MFFIFLNDFFFVGFFDELLVVLFGVDVGVVVVDDEDVDDDGIDDEGCVCDEDIDDEGEEFWDGRDVNEEELVVFFGVRIFGIF